MDIADEILDILNVRKKDNSDSSEDFSFILPFCTYKNSTMNTV